MRMLHQTNNKAAYTGLITCILRQLLTRFNFMGGVSPKLEKIYKERVTFIEPIIESGLQLTVQFNLLSLTSFITLLAVGVRPVSVPYSF